MHGPAWTCRASLTHRSRQTNAEGEEEPIPVEERDPEAIPTLEAFDAMITRYKGISGQFVC